MWQLKNPNIKGRTKVRDNKRPKINKSIADAVNKQVEKTFTAAIKATESEASHDAQTDNQARAYIMLLLKETKAETTPEKPILKNVTLKSIFRKVKKSPKCHALLVTSSVFHGTPYRRREGETENENKTWYPGGSKIIQGNSHLRLLISTAEISELNNSEDYENDATSEK